MIAIQCDKCEKKMEFHINCYINFGNTHSFMIPFSQDQQNNIFKSFSYIEEVNLLLCDKHYKKYLEIKEKHYQNLQKELEDWKE